MGCCCFKVAEDEYFNEIPNNSKVQIAQQQVTSSINVTNLRQEGKKYFNGGEFRKAVQCYEKVIKNDRKSLVNYTNLALAQKACHDFQKSISTINRMQIMAKQIKEFGLTFVKGRIIKARCQSILVKQFCLSIKKKNALTYEQSKKLINESVDTLKELSESKEYKSQASRLGIEKYLNNSLKIKAFLTGMKNKLDESEQILISYLQKRFQSPDTVKQFSLSLNKFYKKPNELLQELLDKNNEMQRSFFNEDDDERQFIIDPITYDQFQNPILLKSGLTYEENCIMSHYQKNGVYDPITKEKFKDEHGVRNHTLMTYINQTKRKNNLNQLKQIEI